jgi:hypothetical protein
MELLAKENWDYLLVEHVGITILCVSDNISAASFFHYVIMTMEWTLTPESENMTQKLIIDDFTVQKYVNDSLVWKTGYVLGKYDEPRWVLKLSSDMMPGAKKQLL